jgi:hypothetical protein
MPVFPPLGGGVPTASFNILDFGAQRGTDCTSAIRNAITAAEGVSTASFSSIYIPAGDWLISDEISWTKAMTVWGEGPVSRLIATGSPMATKFLFHQQGDVIGPTVFQNLSLINNAPTSVSSPIGGCIKQTTNMPFLTLENMFFQSSGDCVYTLNVFLFNASGVKCLSAPDGSGLPYAGRGFAVNCSGGEIKGCDFQGLGTGILLSGDSCNVMGCRLEANNVAIKLGTGPDGVNYTFNSGTISGLELEANGTALDTGSATLCTFSNFSCAGEQQGSLGGINSVYGIIGNGQNVYRLIDAGGDYLGSAFQINSGPCVVELCSAGNAQPKPAWDIRAPLNQVNFVGLGANFECNPDSLPIDYQGTNTRSLSTFNALSSHLRQSNNLGKVGVAVSSGTSVAVAFPAAFGGGDAEISSLVDSVTSGSLVSGTTYYYFATILSENGETGGSIALQHSHAPGVGKTSITVTVFGTSSDSTIKRRIYRGTASGVYDGYYELALGVTSFTDTGAAFSGFGNPPATGTSITGQEPDASYGVLANFSWNAGAYWVTGKATSGFTLHWTTDPGGAQTFDWLLFR